MTNILYSIAIMSFILIATPGFASLDAYLARPEPEFRWEKSSESGEGLVTITQLKMRSQVWRGIPWDHTIRLFRPVVVKYPKTALLLVWGGNPSSEDRELATLVSTAIQAPLAILYNIPNQPLFDGKTEDDLIAHSYSEFMKTGDATWPLLFPMTKSAVKAMDALQEFSKQEWKQKIEQFVVAGASKRGWTSFLTGASDRRVKAIIPMVYDNLNLEAQMPHQLQLWGKYSEQIEDYTRRGLQQQMGSERGKQLARMVDPWYYRDRLKLPKLLIHGANDRYWATDATSLYWGDLSGPKWLLSVPNSGHGLEDRGRVIATTVAFFHHIAGKKPFPRLEIVNGAEGEQKWSKIHTSIQPSEVRLWTAKSETLDFRQSKWESSVMTSEGTAYKSQAPRPEKGGVAWFSELVYKSPLGTYTLSTPARVAKAN